MLSLRHRTGHGNGLGLVVKMAAPVDPCEFIELVQPLLAQRDLAGLCTLLKSHWDCDQIRALLRSHHTDAKKVALLALGLVGPRGCTGELADQLRDPDPMVNQMAEHALWSIWFRSGSCEANRELARGTQRLNERDFPAAIAHFTQAIELDPTFAEAYNQRAIAHYLEERYDQSIEDCRRTVERAACHFGAWAGMGHCYAHKGRIDAALDSYETALRINPHLDCIRETVEELKRPKA